MGKVTLKNISKSYQADKEVIKDLDLTIEDGEFCVFLGPSGCGKTTLLRLIAGLETIQNGDIFINDRLINDVAPKDRGLAMVFQNYALYPHKTVFENLAFPLEIKKTPTPEIQKKVALIAETLKINDHLQSYPRHLSGGQMQRVAIGRALVQQPDIFLFDEPLSNLDAKLRVSMRSDIKQLHNKHKKTFIYVTHDQIEAMALADKIVIIDQGKIQQIGTPEDIYHNPNHIFTASFTGTPSMNLAIFPKEQNNSHFSNELTKQLTKKHSELIWGIRPEKLSLNSEKSSDYITGSIYLSESRGHDYIYYIKPLGIDIYSQHFTIVSQEKIEFSKNQNLKFYFKQDDIFFFGTDGKRCQTPSL
ncbi:MAG: ABC transporter ATP-binding protein [bacterium]|nr:ABC transporter ATP-binding protein [bacterium]